MSYRAKVVKVMIASPSDVAAERQIVRNVLQEWNNTHAEDKNIVLMPVDWESHSAPALGRRPQAIINKQVLADCDLLIAVFWTKVGTPTGKAVSGTVEEIEEHVKAKKPAMVYFSSIPVAPQFVDVEQLTALQEFKRQLRDRGLYAEYESTEAFREKLTRQLAQTVMRHFASKKNDADVEPDRLSHDARLPTLSEQAKIMLIEAAQEISGTIFKSRTMHGTSIHIGRKNLIDDQNPRIIARWEAALRALCEQGFVEDRGHQGEVFAVTDEGYRIVDRLKERQLVPL